MCPYARFQSVMYDEDTLLVSYHAERGEPRTSVKNPVGGGDCVDCKLCVQVCPTGIDIRNGSQISCINCALCADACDEVMTSLGRKPKLISFTSLNGLKGKPSHILRPKTIAYTLVLCVLLAAFGTRLFMREPVEANILRDRGTLSYTLASGQVANDYVLKITNKAQQDQVYSLAVQTPGYTLRDQREWTVVPGEMLETRITLVADAHVSGARKVDIAVRDVADGTVIKTIETRFIDVGR